MIPPNDSETHYLPPGIHLADSLQEVVARFGYSPERKKMLCKLKDAISILKDFGCKRIFLDGSFLRDDKPVPGDYDVVWDDAGLDLDECYKMCFTFFKFDNKRALQKKEFLGEFFRAGLINADNGKTFLDTFQQDDRPKSRTLSKGIVEINIDNL